MNFDRYLAAFDDEAGGKEQTALSIYFSTEVEGQSSVRQSEVKSLIQESRSTFSPTGVSRYFSRLKNSDLITSVGNREYRLTSEGIQEVEKRLDDDSLLNNREEDDRFIDLNVFEEDGRYEQLVEDINECYRYRIYDATLVLTRKFFEDMVYQILKTHYAGENVQMFYDQKNNRHYSFEDLLNNLRDGVPTLRRYSRELDQELVEDLRELKDEGNSGAHAVRVEFRDDEVEALSTDATRIAEHLYDTLKGARVANRD